MKKKRIIQHIPFCIPWKNFNVVFSTPCLIHFQPKRPRFTSKNEKVPLNYKIVFESISFLELAAYPIPFHLPRLFRSVVLTVDQRERFYWQSFTTIIFPYGSWCPHTRYSTFLRRWSKLQLKIISVNKHSVHCFFYKELQDSLLILQGDCKKLLEKRCFRENVCCTCSTFLCWLPRFSALHPASCSCPSWNVGDDGCIVTASHPNRRSRCYSQVPAPASVQPRSLQTFWLTFQMQQK